MPAPENTESSPEPVLQPSPAQTGTAPWYVYLGRAANGALYCGITTDPKRRMQQHQSGKGARFFHSSPARAMVYLETCTDHGSALRRERAIKQLPKQQKEQLAQLAKARQPC